MSMKRMNRFVMHLTADEVSPWQCLPDSILLHVFSNLNAVDLVGAGRVCQTWFRVACDEFLWKALFHLEWHVPLHVGLPPGRTWREEFKRLKWHVPVEEVEVIKGHRHEVLHVSFSHDGKTFASCSKDGFVKVWNAEHPVSLRYSCDMKDFNWKYTQFSQFNESDTLLLVSGVHPGLRSTMGEIAIFTLEAGFNLKCKVHNNPYDIFGAWYSDEYLLSGDLRVCWQDRLVSSSVVWLNKASQEIENADKSVIKRMYFFYNVNGSSIRTIMIANCKSTESYKENGECSASLINNCVTANSSYNCEVTSGSNEGASCGNGDGDSEDDGDDVLDEREKYLIFTTGSKTYTPHQIGFKKIHPFHFEDKININWEERLAAHREANNSPGEVNILQNGEIPVVYDGIDHCIDLHGHIIGMALSPDERYLYVNSRSWPQDCKIEDPMYPPPIAQEIDIHVIDMSTLKKVGTLLRAHKAYTPHDECFFIFLDVSESYVASGAEDKQGYVWDRHYSTCLAKLPHSDVVNCVAINPCNEEMLVTASDDMTLKVWGSKYLKKKLMSGRKLSEGETFC